jgi:hypothetical protein
MLAFLWRILVFVLLARVVSMLLRRLLPGPEARSRRPAPPAQPPRPAHPPLGKVVDAEFEDLGENR